MGIAATIAEQIHGIPINTGGIDPVCDCEAESPTAVNYDDEVQYECLRIGDSLRLFEPLPHGGRWVADLLRCEGCEIESLGEPTEGFGEALVELDLTWHNDQLVLDTRELTLLDYSPVDEGRELPELPQPVVDSIFQNDDPGVIRRSRLIRSSDFYRRCGFDRLVDDLEAQR